MEYIKEIIINKLVKWHILKEDSQVLEEIREERITRLLLLL